MSNAAISVFVIVVLYDSKPTGFSKFKFPVSSSEKTFKYVKL